MADVRSAFVHRRRDGSGRALEPVEKVGTARGRGDEVRRAPLGAMPQIGDGRTLCLLLVLHAHRRRGGR
jgi:hypothetical protein